ncbi:MAG: NUDIX hydrolase [Nitrospirae bacterium]|nr:NUDIX hydrolase [Nitrospirota bacterium]
MRDKKPALIKRQTSSGGVIFRRLKGKIEVAIIAVRDRSVWCLPKGAIDKNEDSKAAALREVKEETGLSGEITGEIGKISYWYFLKNENAKLHKTVYFFLMEYRSGSTDDHDSEVDASQWFTIEEALGRLSYKGEKEILRKAKGMIEKIEP